ncbi:hypothetical protein I3843_09G007400 [Carya illinoinensis]|uniref:DUF668 domain-containing protein n=1 Tax=Carya illinoinensis TaxID=32201 RepID=A0A8T1PFN5_CARIL|nr:protein PSK SIMULATOR 1-like [Carya illinoinensis]XP_042943007.1 protein PSK SIMULATOR 1-like [Carya illinoinensis]KAG6640493.1 hypothetical protein CIPAW_09G007600 [Carya illinoinensis]KAG6693581.1 hypothetical protein I3842_09G007600 [Carya illinoinensis]KAG7961283.1 hypothetical protein I3843_09G007400 [Carya illinoinensis]
MGGESVTESWFGSLRWISRKGGSDNDKGVIEILAFEVASLMLKVVNLWQSLGDKELHRLREEVANSIGLKKLVSDDDDYLMELALNEIVENFVFVARSVARFGKRCRDPIYHRFEQFVNDPIQNGFQWVGWEYKWKKMERKVKKMERFIASMTQLSQELEVLVELEQTLRRMQNAELNRAKVLDFQQKVIRQRHEVRNLRGMSPWNRTYDYIVRLLMRSLFTILERIKHVLGTFQVPSVEANVDSQLMNIECFPRSHSFSAIMYSSIYPSENNLGGFYSGCIERSISKPGNADKSSRKEKQRQDHHWPSTIHGNHPNLESNWFAHAGPFKGCMPGGSESPVVLSCKPTGGGSMRLSSVRMKNIDEDSKTNMKSFSCSNRVYSKLSFFNSKCRSWTAPPSSLGGAALALHYANVIILIERLASAPHLMDLDTRDDLYNRLPSTIRSALRARLKSYVKTMTSSEHNAALAAEWSLAHGHIFDWLVPLAHNMTRWHSERNFEKHYDFSKTNVLLVQTLHFANQAKTEAAITELLVGLNYICRIGIEHQRKHVQEPAIRRPCYDYTFIRDDIAYNV